ncbi:hypothetical protein ACJMK2_034279 [Sinanodonta woodiana]|uniref:procollagen-proline 4-dioxygenase n=1 Tax=Sinanodonta woodiana TaxID=1069815 RepID=A0ABD3WV82_SINWO
MAATKLYLSSAVLLICALAMVYANVFTAVVKLQKLHELEASFLSGLNEYLTRHRSSGTRLPILQDVERFLSTRFETNRTYLDKHYVENPINAFRLVRRIHKDREELQKICQNTGINYRCRDEHENCLTWAAVGECVQNPNFMLVKCKRSCNICQILKNSTEEVNHFWADVTDDDVSGAAKALVRLWRTYNLNIDDVIGGKILDEISSPLTIEEVYDIAHEAGDQGLYYSQIIWIEALHRRMKNLNKQIPENQMELNIYRMLAWAYSKKFMPWKAVEIVRNISTEDKGFIRDVEYFKVKASEIPETNRLYDLYVDVPEKQQYEALCRGEGIRPVHVTSRLKCYLRATIIPFYRAKEEVLNFDPRLSLFHDVIHEAERKEVRESVYNSLQRSRVVGSNNGEQDRLADTRVSETAWLADQNSPLVRKLSQRVEIQTGLSTSQLEYLYHAEEMQVLNYGIGGMYEPHNDFFDCALSEHKIREGDPVNLKGSGDRIATWLYYLNGVKTGGSTVFTKLNVTVPVVEGAAAFWFNLKRNGVGDELTEHAGCPVLLGSKWVSNKWIRETGQVFRRLCGKTIDAIDEPFD